MYNWGPGSDTPEPAENLGEGIYTLIGRAESMQRFSKTNGSFTEPFDILSTANELNLGRVGMTSSRL